MQKIFRLGILLLCGYLFYFLAALPCTQKINLPPLPLTDKLLLIPLDSRPPCTALAQQLGALASIDVIVPPNNILDNHQQPANRQKLTAWLQTNIANTPAAAISGDLLIHGGLLGSRLPLGTAEDAQSFLQTLNQLPATADITVFSIIPRLLVSDALLPDAWYQWHLMRYSTLHDVVEQLGDYAATDELQKIKQRIPAEILAKYNSLYAGNDALNKKLAALCGAKNYTLVIGQDDAQPFGLPNRNLTHAAAYMRHAGLGGSSATTCGADEIAQMLVARRYCAAHNWQPKFYIEYTTPQGGAAIMPYMAVTAQAALLDKINFIGGVVTPKQNDADVILFVHCGSAKQPATDAMAQRLANELNGAKPVALVDCSEDYEAAQMLLPKLVANGVPINRLCAYAAWNTFGNAAGTAAAQAAIFTGQLKQLPPALYPRLYAQNLNFTAARFLDDYYYQKELHACLAAELRGRGADPANLAPAAKAFAQTAAEGFIYNKRFNLLHGSLARTSFYADAANEYYLTGINAKVTLPWNRIFEISLQTNGEFGVKPLN